MQKTYVLVNEDNIIYSVRYGERPCENELDVTEVPCTGLPLGKQWTGSEFVEPEKAEHTEITDSELLALFQKNQ